MDNTVRTFQAVGLTTSIFLAGINIGSSLLTLPLLYSQPASVSTPIFTDFYNAGKISLVPLGIFSASCSAMVAYLNPSQRELWAIAAVATISQVPWTVLVMMKTNLRLIEISESSVEQEKAGKDEVVGLLRKWAWMNGVRGSLALVGGLVGLWAVMEN
jgi:hypothetical protein